MIAKLTGFIDTIGSDWIILDVQGVGYHLSMSLKSLARLPQVGQKAVILTEPIVRQEQMHLYGFIDAQEKDCFRTLMSVQGVGARMALAILSTLTPQDLSNAIFSQDKAAITRADGVGPKLASRIVLELKGTSFSSVSPMVAQLKNPSPSSISEALSALTNLGYRHSEALQVLTQVQAQNPQCTVQDLIRLSLGSLSSALLTDTSNRATSASST